MTSGVRLGSPAATTRGFGAAEFRQVGEWIGEVLRGLAQPARTTTTAAEARVRGAVSGAVRPLSDLSDQGRGG